MSNSKTPINIFLSRMAQETKLSVTAANALLEFTKNNPTIASSYAEDIAAYTQSSNMALRALAGSILSLLDTEQSLHILFTCIAKQDKDDIARKVEVEGYCGEPLICWMLNNLSSGNDNCSGKYHRTAIDYLVAIASDRESYPELACAVAMNELYYYTQSYHDDIRAEVKFPQNLFDSTTSMVDSNIELVSSASLQLLAHISGRIERVPKTASTNNRFERIDFSKAKLESLISHYGPYRFAAVHPADFELIIGMMFSRAGFGVEETSYVGDFGADLIASKGQSKIAVQVKRYASTTKVSVGDINQVIGAKQYYDCNKSLVVATSDYTRAAKEMAKKAEVTLWNWDSILMQIEKLFGKQLF
ncbi:MAG: restriction endonuclease [Planctomycetes bacterium]|nr:restriction endonuclease [Planctomycetota bacterium]